MFLEQISNERRQNGWIEVVCGSMFSGKTEELIRRLKRAQFANQRLLLIKPRIDNRYHTQKVVSHQGTSFEAVCVDAPDEIIGLWKNEKVVAIDEAQFLSKVQIRQLGEVADKLNIPVMCYGIRTDFRGELFEGSSELLALADNLIELKTICYDCGRKATMVVRVDEDGKVVTEGSKIQIGGNDIYTPVCRKHFRKRTKII